MGSGALIGLVEATKLGTMSGSIKSCHLCIGSITHDNEVTEDDSTSLQHKDLIFTAERGICQQFLAYGVGRWGVGKGLSNLKILDSYFAR